MRSEAHDKPYTHDEAEDILIRAFQTLRQPIKDNGASCEIQLLGIKCHDIPVLQNYTNLAF